MAKQVVRLCDLKPTHEYVGGFSAGRFERGMGWRIWSVDEQQAIAYVESRGEQTSVVWTLNHKPSSFDETCTRCLTLQVMEGEAWCRICQAKYQTVFDNEEE